MQEITVLKVKNGVIKALDNQFPDLNIYDEEIKQEMKAPCFFVQLLTTNHNHDLWRRYIRTYSFSIHYFAKNKKNDEMMEIVDNLYSALELIQVEDSKYRGVRMYHEVIDRVLYVFVDYDTHLYKPRPREIKMQTLDQEAIIHGRT